MKYVLWMACALLIVVSVCAAEPTFGDRDSRGNGNLDQTWGPDPFGYRAVDDLEPDGPAVNWMDISGIGTRVDGLSDDNSVGPFAIGWPFHFYWYDVHQFWIGSNGFIKFSSRGQLGQPFSAFHSPAEPNDIVGPQVSDLLFSASDTAAQCYYWSNGADTLIVMWKNVPAYDAGGSRNFELILAGVDSSITFQYGTQTGGVLTYAGIENMGGNCRLTTMNGVLPRANSAVRIVYPVTLNSAIHDLATCGVQNPTSGGTFVFKNDSIRPWAQFCNVGNQIESGCTVWWTMRLQGGPFVAGRDTLIGTVNPLDTIRVAWPPFAASVLGCGTYLATAHVLSGLDTMGINDSMTAEIHVVDYPCELAYDDTASDGSWLWTSEDRGFAMEFVPPVYPAVVTQTAVYIVAPSSGWRVDILDDDGPGGSPGTVLWSGTSPVVSSGWTTHAVPEDSVVINSGSFFVSYWSLRFGIDTTKWRGISRRTWEYVEGWGQNRWWNTGDVMIRCSIGVIPTVSAFSRIAPADSSRRTWSEAGIEFRWSGALDRQGGPVTYLFDASNADTTLHFVVHDTVFTNSLDGLLAIAPDSVNQVWWSVRATNGTDTVPATNNPGTIFLFGSVSSSNDPPSMVRDFALRSYPNPFNPTVTIAYDVPAESRVELKIFNLVGEQVSVLQDGRIEAGHHRVQWQADHFPTGTYFAVLKAGDHTRIQKLLLLK